MGPYKIQPRNSLDQYCTNVYIFSGVYYLYNYSKLFEKYLGRISRDISTLAVYVANVVKLCRYPCFLHVQQKIQNPNVVFGK